MFGIQKMVDFIKCTRMKISFATFRTDFGVDILDDIQLAVKPMLPSYFLLRSLAAAKLADHIF